MDVDQIAKRPAQMSLDEVATALAVLNRGEGDAQAIRAGWRGGLPE